MAYIGAGITRFNTADELTVTGTSEFGGNVSFGDNNITNVGSLQIDSIAGDADTNTNITFAGSDVITMTTAGSERLRLDASGNVGIGTTSPSTNLEINGGANNNIVRIVSTDANANIEFADNTTTSGLQIGANGDNMKFGINGTEAMRITADGSVAISKTAYTSVSTDGYFFEGGSTKFLQVSSTGNGALFLNRNGSDGGIINLYKSGTTVGSVGTVNGDIFLGTSNTSVRFQDGSNAIIPVTSTGADRDNATDLGTSAQRFKDGYFSNRIYTGGIAGENDTNTQITFPGSDVIKFLTGGSERMRLDSEGGLRVGTTGNIFNTSATEQATINNPGQGNALTLQSTNITGGFPILYLSSTDTTASQNAVVFQRTGGGVGTITTSASSTAYNTSSDHRLKENLVDLTGATTRLKQLNPVRFNFIADADTTVDGFLAHEVQTVVPEAITGTHNEVDNDGNPVYQGIDQSKLVPLLVATIQELEARIAALEAE